MRGPPVVSQGGAAPPAPPDIACGVPVDARDHATLLCGCTELEEGSPLPSAEPLAQVYEGFPVKVPAAGVTHPVGLRSTPEPRPGSNVTHGANADIDPESCG